MTDDAVLRSWSIDVPEAVALWLHGFIALTGLLLVASFLALRVAGRRPSWPLIFLLLLFSFQALANIAYQRVSPAWMPGYSPLLQLLELRAIVGFIFGPLALLYVREFVQSDWPPGWKDLLHAVPVVVMASTLYIWPEWEINIYAYASTAALFAYAGLAWRLTRQTDYLNLVDRDRRLWFWLTCALFLVLLGVNAVATNFNCRPISDPAVRLYQAALLLSIIVLIYIFVTAGFWKRFVLFPSETRSSIRPRRQSADSALVSDYLLIMEREGLWCDPKMSLLRLAKRLDTSPRRLSRAVRDELGVGSSDWINARRVEAVKDVLRADPYTDRSLLDIALEAGFNSKPSFNRAFSKHVGLTPSAFRDQLRV